MGYIDSYFLALGILYKILIIAILMFAIAFYAYKKEHLTNGGIVAAVLVGSITTYIGGLSGLCTMLFFFISVAGIGHVVKTDRSDIQKKGAKRDFAQVLANSVPSIIGLFFYQFTPYKTTGLIMFASGIAEATADTWAGELGMLSKSDPISIITFTKVPKGLSGGVSTVGTLSAFLASLLIAMLSVGCYTLPAVAILIITISGTLGSLCDSFLGATVQVHYRREDGALTEKEEINGVKNVRARGIPFINNDMVNFLSGLFALLISFILSLFI